MVMGPPAGCKGTLAADLAKDHIILNRDKAGGKVIDLLPKMEQAIKQGKSVLLDNLFPNPEARKPFIDLARSLGVPIHAHLMDTKIEDATINALWRMVDRHQKVFLTPEDIKNDPKAKESPNIFPIAVLFKYKKEAKPPQTGEGFSTIKKHKFVRRPLGDQYSNSAYIFDYDDTLRHSTGELDFPTKPSEVSLLPKRKEKMQELANAGNILLGVSNQSGIARKQLTEDNAKACFDQTNKLLGVDIEYHYCPHNVPPSCYCRKPQSGIGVWLIYKHKLDPSKVIFVGDQTTDKTWAERLGFKYVEANEFFK